MFKPLIISAVCAVAALAQTAVPNEEMKAIKMGDYLINYAPMNVAGPFLLEGGSVAGAPYSAQSNTHRLQVLGDGNRIEQTNSSFIARDSQGRVRTERILSGVSNSGGESPRIVTIEDPIGGFNYTLDIGSKTAFKMSAPKPSREIATAKALRKSTLTKNEEGSPRANVTETDLGTQTIDGVVAQGRRVTKIIPAGSIGNEQPIVITTETWYSPDLKVLVMSKSNDPRIGETTYNLTNIQRTEPSAALFQVPLDFTVKEQPGQVFLLQKFQAAQGNGKP